MTAIISVRNLVFEYPRVQALKDVTLEIPQGSITALVGPNGAGKTTLLKCLAGLEKPFSGTVQVAGIDVTRNPRECHRVLAFLPDFFGLYDGLSVRKALHHAAAAVGVPESKIPGLVATSAERLWITDKLDAQVRTLSRGMRQRLAIAQAIAKGPRVLLLDEPASGLDPGARFELSKLFIQLRDEGMTLVVSSHILSELEQYAENLVIMDKGRVVPHQAGPVATEKGARIEIQFLAGSLDAFNYLQAQPGMTVTKAEGDKLFVDLAGGHPAQVQLLRSLVGQGFEVCSFSEQHQDMQSEYMRLVDSRKEATRA